MNGYYYQRASIEASVIHRIFPEFELGGASEKYIIGWRQTTIGKQPFRFMIFLPSGYPDIVPNLYVINPKKLYQRQSCEEIPAHSHDFHMLSKNSYGFAEICHYTKENWHAARSCLGVLHKGMLWSEAYVKRQLFLKSDDN